MEIRLATAADIQTIADMNVEVQNLHAAAMPHLSKAVSDGSVAISYITEQINNPDHYFFIASLDGEDAGYVFARVVRRPENAYKYPWDRVDIDQISVKSTYQGRGCGSALIQAVRELATQQGIETITLDTWGFNEKAQAFFAGQGFTTFNMRMWTRLEA